MNGTTLQTVTVINDLTQADIWILPQTQKNLKTTLWGTATAAKVATGESRTVELCEAGENGCYILRMIDTNHFYYSANTIALQDGYRIRISGETAFCVIAEVTDEKNVPVHSYEVFSARL